VILDPFYMKLATSFFVGGLWISGVTYLAERLGTRLGGLLAGLPSTVVLAMLFIGWTQGPEMVYQTTTAFPIAFGVLGPFLLMAAGALRFGIGVAFGSAFLVWAVLQWLVIRFTPSSYGVAAIFWAGMFLLTLAAMIWVLKLRPRDGRRLEYSARQMLLRAVFSGGVIVCSVVASKLGGPVWGSIFSSFPAVFTTSMVITYYSLGDDFARSMTLSLLVSAMVNCMVFVSVLRWSVLTFGVLPACMLAYLSSFISAFLLYRFVLTHWR
jgi:hypothetical protein